MKSDEIINDCFSELDRVEREQKEIQAYEKRTLKKYKVIAITVIVIFLFLFLVLVLV